ncbi:hypothetical protein HRbin29_00036 [bacterium HR29]|jgi:hypothetical protein|nr:hypothetical protein HRbin29_00036 [bacterium HR29]
MPAPAAVPGRPAWAGAALLAGGLLALAAAAAFVPILLSDESPPPRAGPFRPPEEPYRVTQVVEVTESGPLLEDRSLDLRGAEIARAVPQRIADLRPGEAIVVIGVPNEVRNFAILLIAVTAGRARDGGPPRVFADFSGHEALGTNAAPVAWGTIASVEGERVVVEGPGGEAELTIGEGAPLVRFAPADWRDLAPGDRVAATFDASGRARQAIAVPAAYLPKER